jgi:hypothetical protein
LFFGFSDSSMNGTEAVPAEIAVMADVAELERLLTEAD